MVTNPISNPTPYTAPAATTGSSSSTKATGSTDVSQQMVLQLLVAQIKNQDPTSPADPSQFVAQLAQFSQLEQTIAIRQGVDTIAAATPASTTTSTTGTTTGATSGA